jgi:hypothetical protein
MSFFLNKGLNQVAKVGEKFPADIFLPANTGRLNKRTTTGGSPFSYSSFNNSISLIDWINNAITTGDIATSPGVVTSVISTLVGTDLTTTVNGVSDTEDLSSLSAGGITVEDVFTSISTVNALSANRGRILYDNQTNIVSSLGTALGASTMGVYSGAILSDNDVQTTLNQELSDAIEAIPAETLTGIVENTGARTATYVDELGASTVLNYTKVAASAVNNRLGMDVTQSNETFTTGINVAGLTDVGNPSDDDMLLVYEDGTTTNKKVSADHFLPKNRAFAADTSVAPATSGEPTAAEIKTWNDGLGTPNLDTIIYYTGDDTSTNTPTYVFHSDRAGIITLISEPVVVGGGSATRNYLSSALDVITIDDGGSPIQILTSTDGVGNTTVTIPSGVEFFEMVFPSEVIGKTGADKSNITFDFLGARVYNQSVTTRRLPQVSYFNRVPEDFSSPIEKLGGAGAATGQNPQITYESPVTATEVGLIVDGIAESRWSISVKF